MGSLDGKVAIVTGGARGMGKSHVRRFVDEGARVVIGDVLEDEGAKLAADLGDAVRFVRMDVTRAEDWENAVRTAVGTYGALHVLVNNAGILKHRTIEEMTLDEARAIIEVNLLGQWQGVKAVIEPMKASGGGSIINVSSTEGFIGASGLAAYSASKFGVRGLTKAAARELGQYGIRVNSIHPGAIITGMSMQQDVIEATADRADALIQGLPLGRLGNSREVSGLVAYLASDDASYCTGSEVLVDGGLVTGSGY
ncbi:glucose 1-dehydrogenase [Actinomadura rupiterrae]|uniref:glucose 1-dehydrogenase n=1 Tax=Actinomadura rupiterrae TaxID=559627 RepID=UPI0020A5F54A|nr:glucose 1-dehydrogenase [Actinomadura rupiterrae]MCP2339626.1 3alpha(or 20beta)-hydroxysteroid dehydrogenase [Actinomadura rupiterrae]